jgi:O-antigen ligase
MATSATSLSTVEGDGRTYQAVIYLVALTIPLSFFGSGITVAGNFSLADILLTLAGLMVLSDPSVTKRVAIAMGRRYAAIALATSAALMIQIILSGQPSADFKYALQLLFIVWVATPITAAGIDGMRSPLRFLSGVAFAYIAVYILGLLLHFGFHTDALVFQQGPGRVYSSYIDLPIQQIALALGCTWIATGGKNRARGMGVLLCGLIPVVLNASRTGLATIAALVLFAAVLEYSATRRSGPLIAIFVIGLAVVVANMYSGALEDSLYFRLVNIGSFAEDEVRRASMRASIEAITTRPSILFFGSGWGTSGADLVTHNLVLQVSQEAGILFLLPLLALLMYPATRVLRSPAAIDDQKMFVLLLTAALLIFWLLNALVVQRPLWVPLAVAIGISNRVVDSDQGAAL